MADELLADFERRLPKGPTVRARFAAVGGRAPVTVLFGRSGVGKTTVLRCLAGLDRPDRGVVKLGATVLSDRDRGIFVPPQARGLAYVAQQPALFPHLRVGENVAYGIDPRMGRDAVAQAVHRAASAMGVEGLLARAPRELSGGEQQRVALARALARDPRLVLLDEPLSALDGPTRAALRGVLRRALVAAGVPAVLVTHDRGEALALGDRVAVLTEDGVAQTGEVWEVFSRPASVAVAHLVGTETVSPARVISAGDGMATVVVGEGAELSVVSDVARAGDAVFVCVRAEDVTLESGAAGASSARNRLAGHVRAVQREGALVRVTVACGFELVALVTRGACEELGLAEGARVTAVIKATSVVLVAR